MMFGYTSASGYSTLVPCNRTFGDREHLTPWQGLRDVKGCWPAHQPIEGWAGRTHVRKGPRVPTQGRYTLPTDF
jgi:hypothetical protein